MTLGALGTASRCAGTVSPGTASNVTLACWLACRRAASASANGATTWRPATLLRTMKDPLPLLALELELELEAPPAAPPVEPELLGWGALLPGAWAAAPEPPPDTASPGWPLT